MAACLHQYKSRAGFREAKHDTCFVLNQVSKLPGRHCGCSDPQADNYRGGPVGTDWQTGTLV